MSRRVALSWGGSLAAEGVCAEPAFGIDASRWSVWVQVETALGPFVVAVDVRVAPVTVANFLAYVDASALDGATVYRVVASAHQPVGRAGIDVVQWGLNSAPERPIRRRAIAHESTLQTGLRHRDGTLSMARSALGTASSDFFVCVGDQPALDHGGQRHPDGQGFAAFGEVVRGMPVVRALHAHAGAETVLSRPIPIHRVRRVVLSSPSG